MSSSVEVVSEIRAWWSTEGQEHIDQLMQIEADLKTCSNSIDDINNKKGDGSFCKLLSNAWARVTTLPQLNKEKSQLEKKFDGINSLLADKAAEDGDLLLAAIASEHELVWLSYSSILYGLKDLSDKQRQGEDVGDKYNVAMQQYTNLRLYVATNSILPEGFYKHIPQSMEQDRKFPSAGWRFDF